MFIVLVLGGKQENPWHRRRGHQATHKKTNIRHESDGINNCSSSPTAVLSAIRLRMIYGELCVCVCAIPLGPKSGPLISIKSLFAARSGCAEREREKNTNIFRLAKGSIKAMNEQKINL